MNNPFATRPLELAIRTRPIAWCWARHCGKREGLAGFPLLSEDLAGCVSPERGSPMPASLMTEYLRGRIQRYVERDEREFSVALASVDSDVRALWALHDEIEQVTGELPLLMSTLNAVQDEPKVTAQDIVRGPAERDADEAIMISRRQRAKDARAVAVREEIAAIESRLAGLRRRYAEHAYVVMLAFDHYVTRTGQARAQIERLCAEYRRQVTLHHPDGTAIQRAWADTVSVPTPDRATGPCPWLPAESVPAPATKPTKEN